MCGIVGFLTDEGWSGAQQRRHFFEQALYLDAVRGFDSTGYFRVQENNMGVVVNKKAILPSDFLDLRVVDKDLSKSNTSVLIGHNRAATAGATTNRNAHPFHHGKIVGVHNGTLDYGWDHLLPDGKGFTVDSEAIMSSFNKAPYQDVIEKIAGAFVLVWHDEDDKVIRIVRNKERPLWIGKVKGQDTLLLSSEQMMLRWVAGRNGYTLEDVIQPEPGVLMEFPDDDVIHFSTEKVDLRKNFIAVHGNTGGGGDTKNVNPRTTYSDLGVQIGKKYEFYATKFSPYREGEDIGYLIGEHLDIKAKGEPITCITHNVSLKKIYEELGVGEVQDVLIEGNFAAVSYMYAENLVNPHLIINSSDAKFFALGYDDTEEAAAQELEEEIKAANDEDNTSIFEFGEDQGFRGPHNKPVTEDEWLKLTAGGCCMCGDPIDPRDFAEITFLEDKHPVCPDPSCKANAIYGYQ